MPALTVKEKEPVLDAEYEDLDEEDFNEPEPALPVFNPSDYVPGDLRPGMLLLTEFSRPGAGKKFKDPRLTTPSALNDEFFKKHSAKVVSTAHAVMARNYTHTPWGWFSEPSKVSLADEILRQCRETATVLNYLAKENHNPRRVRIDVYPLPWDVNDEKFRLRMGQWIAEKLMHVRLLYTSERMWKYRVRMDAVRHLEKLVVGKQHDVVAAALAATAEQRRVMVALYGDKIPAEWIDPESQDVRKHIKLDTTAVDTAIRHFLPIWEPEEFLEPHIAIPR